VKRRIPPLARADMSAETLDQLRYSFPRADPYFAEGPDTPPMPPILGLLARHSALAGPWLSYNGALLERGLLDDRAREILILETVRRTGSTYLWQEHLTLAAAAGVSTAEVASLRGETGHDWSERDDALIQAVDELVTDHVVSDRTWHLLSQFHDEQQLLELLFVVGTYSCLAMVLNSTGITTKEAQP
jgi:4-carboxymuconolactone decarboxylase